MGDLQRASQAGQRPIGPCRIGGDLDYRRTRIVPALSEEHIEPGQTRYRLVSARPRRDARSTQPTLRKEWRDACVACGLGRKIEVPGKAHDPRSEGLTLHDLRPSAARSLLLAGVPETIVIKSGGWKTRSVFDRYVHSQHRRSDGSNAARGNAGTGSFAPTQRGTIGKKR